VEERDLYADLGIEKAASEEEIRKAYRRLARKHHPDVNPGDPEAEERFKRVSFANDVLSDPEKRRRYDEFGMAGLADGFDPEQAHAYRHWQEGAQRSPFGRTPAGGFEGNLDDLLGELFGAGARGRPRGPARGRDVAGDVEVDFLDAVRGGEVRVEMARPDGERKSLRIRIPPGAAEGTRIRLAGQGDPGAAGGPAGDLLLRLHVRSHADFRREGDDLRLELPVTLPELIRGGPVEVPTPDGPVQMKIPPRSQNGRTLRLRERGASKRGGGTGDLLVNLVARLPEKDDPELDEIAERLDALYSDVDVRAKLRGSG
jgi:DnaJ-class molecular chaperone